MEENSSVCYPEILEDTLVDHEYIEFIKIFNVNLTNMSLQTCS
jgi:hypothetical protein